MTASEGERMVPFSQAVRLLNTGFEWESGLFVEVFRELSGRIGREEAREVLRQAMYRTGVRLGVEARQFAAERGPQGMAQAWDVLYGMGTREAVLLSPKRFLIRFQGCGAYQLMKRWGLSDEEIRFLGDAYCAGDVGQAEGFDPEMVFQHTSRLMHGDDSCEWDYTTTPQQPAAGAVPAEGLKRAE